MASAWQVLGNPARRAAYDVRLALLAELTVRYQDQDQGRPW